MKSFLPYLLIMGVGALLLWGLSERFPSTLDDDFAFADILYMVAILILVGPGVLYGFKNNIGGAFKSIALWAGLLVLAVVGYSFRDDLAPIWQRVKSELIPSSAVITAKGEIELTRAQDGHFYADAFVNGERIRFMVDTGASRVALSYDDARRAGIDTELLDFTKPVSTANGVTFNAYTRLSYVAIGPLHVENVRASVAKQDQMDGSLLGLTFLDELGGYRVEGDRLILWH